MLELILFLLPPVPYRKKRIGQLPLWLVGTSPSLD